MGSNIGPTAGGGVMKPKNANCEGGLQRFPKTLSLSFFFLLTIDRCVLSRHQMCKRRRVGNEQLVCPFPPPPNHGLSTEDQHRHEGESTLPLLLG